MDGLFARRSESFRYQRRPGDDCSPGRGGMVQDGRSFMAKWIVAEKVKAGLRHVVVCPNVTGKTKERKAQSKRARGGSLAILYTLAPTRSLLHE